MNNGRSHDQFKWEDWAIFRSIDQPLSDCQKFDANQTSLDKSGQD